MVEYTLRWSDAFQAWVIDPNHGFSSRHHIYRRIQDAAVALEWLNATRPIEAPVNTDRWEDDGGRISEGADWIEDFHPDTCKLGHPVGCHNDACGYID